MAQAEGFRNFERVISSLNGVNQGLLIKNARKKMGLNQTELAELITRELPTSNVDTKKISKWETGIITKIDAECLDVICKILDISLSDFFPTNLRFIQADQYLKYQEVRDAIDFLDFVITSVRERETPSVVVHELPPREALTLTKTSMHEHLFQFLKERELQVEKEE